jgi:toxin ParE1/3/4
MVQVIWLPEALWTVNLVRSYIGQYDPQAADRLAQRLRQAGESLADFPNRGRPAGNGARELPSVPPYIIRYEVSGDRVFILSIRHGRQRPPED